MLSVCEETPQLTEEEERLFSGCLDNLPPESSNIVRVFISSTFLGIYELFHVFSRNLSGIYAGSLPIG